MKTGEKNRRPNISNHHIKACLSRAFLLKRLRKAWSNADNRTMMMMVKSIIYPTWKLTQVSYLFINCGGPLQYNIFQTNTLR
jgi:hypothetical protein